MSTESKPLNKSWLSGDQFAEYSCEISGKLQKGTSATVTEIFVKGKYEEVIKPSLKKKGKKMTYWANLQK